MTLDLTEPHVSAAWLNLAAFDCEDDAEALCRALETEGIPAKVQKEQRLQRGWFWTGQPRAWIHVRVAEPSFAFARDFLEKSYSAKALTETAIHCPSCGSMRVHYPQMTRKNVLPTLIAQALVLVGVMQHEFYCEDCHFTWKPPETAPVESTCNPS